MKKYQTDIDEIILCLNANYNETIDIFQNVEKNKNLAVERISLPIGNEFLDKRGEAIKKMSIQSEQLKHLFSDLYQDCCFIKNCKKCVIAKYCNYNIKNCIDNYDANAPKIIDLFCGAGGLSLGFKQAGFITSLANDIEPCCVDTYAHNHPEVPRENIVLGDIHNVIKNIKNLKRFKNVDVIIGGPPCQGFSNANRQRLIDDPRNVLYKSFVQVVNIEKPTFFVMENVRGMKTVASQVVQDFENIGYAVECRLLNAKQFGVPQNRERLIFIGNKVNIDNKVIFEEIENIGKKSKKHVLSDALKGLRPLRAATIKNATEHGSLLSGRKIEKWKKPILQNDYIKLINQNKISKLCFNHQARYNNERDIEIFGRLNQGDKSDDPKIADIMPYKRRSDIFKDKYFKLEAKKVCKTITAHMKFDCNMYIHPTQKRGLTPREAARIQSYPDSYFFRGSYTKTYMQVGNSVPPLMAKVIASVVKKYL